MCWQMMQMLRQGEFDGEDDLLFLHTGGSPALYAYLPTFRA